MFFTYNQNNSGGNKIFDAKRGISKWVIVEADNASDADDIACEIGLYFGYQEGDCTLSSCCGERWEYASDLYEHDEPQVYDEIVTDNCRGNGDLINFYHSKFPGPLGYIHYRNRNIAPFYIKGDSNA